MASSKFVASLILSTSVALPSLAGAQDHLECFKGKDFGAKAIYNADLQSLLAQHHCTIKLPAKLLCLKATKNNVTPPPPGHPPGPVAGNFACYRVKCPTTFASMGLHDQFGVRVMQVKKAQLLCAPAIYSATTTTTTTIHTTTTTASTITFVPNDFDADGVLNESDNCVFTPNPAQTDSDSDGKGDACDDCPNNPNPGNDPCPP